MKPGWWHALEVLSDGAVMAEWALELGDEFEAARPFLMATNELVEAYPCTNRFQCQCRHRVEPAGGDRWVGVCDCEGGCDHIQLAPKDLLVHEVDGEKLSAAIARALRFQPVVGPAQRNPGRSILVGTYGALRSKVYLVGAVSTEGMGREVERLFAEQAEPFIVLTPMGLHCDGHVEWMLKRQGCLHVPLSFALSLGGKGRLTVIRSVEPLLQEFVKRQTEHAGLVKTVERIDRNIEAVAKGNYELQQQVDELRQFQADGFFQFALRVDGKDFQAFAVIMALGNRSAAAKFLKMPHRSFYDLVDKWASRGKEYQRMVRWIEWRKRNGRKIKVRLEDSLQSGEPSEQPENPETIGAVLDSIGTEDNRDYPDILRQVLEALREQNPKNWQGVRNELVEMIQEEVMQ